MMITLNNLQRLNKLNGHIRKKSHTINMSHMIDRQTVIYNRNRYLSPSLATFQAYDVIPDIVTIAK